MKPSVLPSQRGYSLVEMLVVVAIVGILSLVTVPNFINLYRGAKLKTSLGQFTNDVRLARQRAVSRVAPVKISWQQGTTRREYRVYTGVQDSAGDITWTEVTIGTWEASPLNRRTLDAIAYFGTPSANAFTDQDDPVDGWLDLIFLPSGQVQFASATTITGNVVVRTDMDIGKPTYTVTINNTGRLATQ